MSEKIAQHLPSQLTLCHTGTSTVCRLLSDVPSKLITSTSTLICFISIQFGNKYLGRNNNAHATTKTSHRLLLLAFSFVERQTFRAWVKLRELIRVIFRKKWCDKRCLLKQRAACTCVFKVNRTSVARLCTYVYEEVVTYPWKTLARINATYKSTILWMRGR